MKTTKRDPRKLRRSLNMNQAEFWNRLGVTQSGGSRYETGRPMPEPLEKLYDIAFAKDNATLVRLLNAIRLNPVGEIK